MVGACIFCLIILAVLFFASMFVVSFIAGFLDKDFSKPRFYAYSVLVEVLSIALICFISMHNYIMPKVEKNEYYADKYGIIHGYKCPLKRSSWFTEKHNKYDILIEQGQEICDECLGHEEEKLWDLHYANMKIEERNLRYGGASEEYINNRMNKYAY